MRPATSTFGRPVPARTQVVVLTTYSDDESIVAALRAGALGYLTKDAQPEEIARAIHAVRDGRAQFDPSVQRFLAAAVAAQPVPAPDGLTPRELDVLRLIGAGRSNTEIAAALFVSPATVKTHINNIFGKAALRDRAQAVAYAHRLGLVERDR